MTVPGTRLLRWGLPWLSTLAFSAALTYGVTTAATVGESLPERGAPDITALDAPVSAQGCDRASARLVLYAVSNGWLPARLKGYCGT